MTDLYLDHVLIAVADLGKAAETYELLGFTLTPEGRHPGRGTHNRLIVFGPDYLEPIAIQDPNAAELRADLQAFLQAGEGLFLFALGTSDIDTAVSQLRDRGVTVADPVAGERQGSGGAPGYSWRAAGIAPGSDLGLDIFLIQHNQTVAERYTQPENATSHANAAKGIHHITLAAPDPEAMASRWQTVFNLPPATEVDVDGETHLRLTLENCYMDFVATDAVDEVVGLIGGAGVGLHSLCLAVDDIYQTISTLHDNVIPVSDPVQTADGPMITVSAEVTHGVRLHFIEPE